MWPMRYDLTRDECRKCLRCLELDTYGSMVSVLRAQGPLTSEKQKLLQELAKVLHIPNERHSAEVRRAVNDEKLSIIAEQLNGPNTGADWTVEGRRAIPLIPRVKSRSSYTTLANSLSLATAVANERKVAVYEKAEDKKDIQNESRVELKLNEKLFLNTEFLPVEDKLYETRVTSEEVGELHESKGADKHNTSRKRKSVSPLPMTPPNKVLVVSSNPLARSTHSTVQIESFEHTHHASHIKTNVVQHQNVTVTPLNVNSDEWTAADSEETTTRGSAGNSFVETKDINTVSESNTTKSKGRVTTQSKPNATIIPAVILSNGVSGMPLNNVQPDVQGTPVSEDSITKKPFSPIDSHKPLDSESADSNACTKRVTSIINSDANTTTTVPSTSSNSHRLLAVCPGTSISSGPGPPQAKQTTLTHTKLPTTINHQPPAKVIKTLHEIVADTEETDKCAGDFESGGVTLNPNKTVNLSHHPNTKLTSKNVIVIQKGNTKGVTLSHAGKEVLGKVIMGGKNLCFSNPHNPTSINMLPHHIALNNGDPTVAMLSTGNTNHTESIKSNIKHALIK